MITTEFTVFEQCFDISNKSAHIKKKVIIL